MKKTTTVKDSRTLLKLAKRHGWETRPGNGSHFVISSPDGSRAITAYHSKEYPKGMRCAIEKLCRRYGLLLALIAFAGSCVLFAHALSMI